MEDKLDRMHVTLFEQGATMSEQGAAMSAGCGHERNEEDGCNFAFLCSGVFILFYFYTQRNISSVSWYCLQIEVMHGTKPEKQTTKRKANSAVSLHANVTIHSHDAYVQLSSH